MAFPTAADLLHPSCFSELYATDIPPTSSLSSSHHPQEEFTYLVTIPASIRPTHMSQQQSIGLGRHQHMQRRVEASQLPPDQQEYPQEIPKYLPPESQLPPGVESRHDDFSLHHRSSIQPVQQHYQTPNQPFHSLPPLARHGAGLNWPIQPTANRVPNDNLFQNTMAHTTVHAGPFITSRPVQHIHPTAHQRQDGAPGPGLRSLGEGAAAVGSPGVLSTPVLHRLTASEGIQSRNLTSCLQQDLGGNVRVCPSEFFMDDLWPPSAYKFKLSSDIFDFLSQQGIWDSDKDCFVTLPDSVTEGAIKKWLNMLGGVIGAKYNKKRVRLWSDRNHSQAPAGTDILRKPDLILLDRDLVTGPLADPSNNTKWPMVLAFAEVTVSAVLPSRIPDTINDKSYLMFLTQEDRRFVPALSFDGSGNFSLTITDRQGQIVMPSMPCWAGKGPVFVFLKVLAILMFSDKEHIGLDPTMERKPHGGPIDRILCGGTWYKVHSRIYRIQSIVGRGTSVWVVYNQNGFFILKDSWVQPSRVTSEIDILKRFLNDDRLKGRVPQLIGSEDIYFSNADGSAIQDSTGRYRSWVGSLSLARIHRRLVQTPIGMPVTSFRSKKEFISVVIDIVDALFYLATEKHILHRDISPNNILLVRDNNGALVNGMLIDFDFGAIIGEHVTSDGLRTGTPPFMALGLMINKGKPFKHELRHDLESLLYVILWMCTAMAGPKVENRLFTPAFLEIPLRHWFTPDPNLSLLGHIKLGHIVNAEQAIFPNFPLYWDDFKPFVRKLLKQFFPSFDPLYSGSFDAKIVKAILESACNAVSEIPNNTPMVFSNAASHNRIFQSVVTHSYLSSQANKRQLGDSDYYNPTTQHASKKGNTGVRLSSMVDIVRWQESVQ